MNEAIAPTDPSTTVTPAALSERPIDLLLGLWARSAELHNAMGIYGPTREDRDHGLVLQALERGEFLERLTAP